MSRLCLRFGFAVVLCSLSTLHAKAEPIAGDDLVFEEQDGFLAVEAEHFTKQSKTDTRAFHLTHSKLTPQASPDGDGPHVPGASGGAYIEILPDTRRTHADKLVRGVNFEPQPNKQAVVDYPVFINTPGRYYVWVRAFSTGSEDNGLHVGLDGEWPESGQRLQWCEGKNRWRWESKQRTDKQHCGERYKIYLDIKKPGRHLVQFSMREDGFEFDKWLMTTDRNFVPEAKPGPTSQTKAGTLPKGFPYVAVKTPIAKTPTPVDQKSNTTRDLSTSPTRPSLDKPLFLPRGQDGDGSVSLTGPSMVWHPVTLDLNGPWVHEKDNNPNPFVDYNMTVTFRHEDGTEYVVPGYFAADGDAANTSAESGMIWRAKFTPDRAGEWSWTLSFRSGAMAALDRKAISEAVAPFDGKAGSLLIAPSDKPKSDLRSKGRLQYVGQRYLQHAGSKEFFLKAGADAPETLLAYKGFDNTIAGNPKKAPLKSWSPHLRDYRSGDPGWGNPIRGRELIGAVNYLSGKGCNAFSFLTYNAGGDGDNVWPFIAREDKLHYDCSKLDQWGVVFDHATTKGMYLHFKMQETENDDHNRGKKSGWVPESLDGGNLGPQRKLYCRELVARFAHNLALNWNIGEENTQTTAQQKAMIDYIRSVDPYDHHIVLHTYPDQQDKIYRQLIGKQSELTGLSLQNSSIADTHWQTVKWIEASQKAVKPWVVAFDESGSAAHAQSPDLGYKGFDGRDNEGKKTHTQHEVRKQTLWGTLMAGGAGCEYYFGYRYVENDIVCEDWRSRDQSWDYCRIALGFFREHHIPIEQMTNADHLVGNPKHDNSVYCFAKPQELYLVYLPNGGAGTLDLSGTKGDFSVHWFNPRVGGELKPGSVTQVTAGVSVSVGEPPSDKKEDWLVVIRKLTE